jgi:hypothetical protein
MTALAGKRNFPKDKLSALLTVLSIDGQLPAAGIVHYWRAGADLVPLRSAVKLFRATTDLSCR